MIDSLGDVLLGFGIGFEGRSHHRYTTHTHTFYIYIFVRTQQAGSYR